jgi:Cysteine-rich CPCC
VSDPRFPCLCCGCLTLPEPPPGSDEICEVCGWEDDPVQADDPDFRGGANSDSLDEVRASFARWRGGLSPGRPTPPPAAGGGTAVLSSRAGAPGDRVRGA